MIAIIHCRRRGFSLIELMVTIGIIALLVSMLLPTLGRARAQARQVSCASGLRQIGQGLYVYAAANRGWYPPFGSYQVYGGDGTGDDRPGLGWTEILAPHFVAPDAPIYKCPDFPEEDHRITYFLSARWAYLGNRNSIQQSAVRIASQYVLAAECTRLASYPPQFGRSPHVEDDCDKDDGYARSLVFFGEPLGFNLHPGGNNVLFADGHVSAFTQFEPGSMSYHPKRPGIDWDEVTYP